MENIKEILDKKSKKLFFDYTRDLDERLIKGLKVLGHSKHDIAITRQIFWSICLCQAIKCWERELGVTITWEASNSNVSRERAHKALRAAGCDSRH